MSERAEIQALWALRRVVDNNALADDSPVGGTSVNITWDPESRNYEVEVLDLCSAAAPTLTQALRALEYLDEGEAVLVSHDGRALCLECGGRGCDECHGSGAATEPPHAWPADGVIV